MPCLDVTEVLFDPDFCDTTLVCKRSQQLVDADGFTQDSIQRFPFSGVVTVDR